MDGKKFGHDKLTQQAIEFAASQISWEIEAWQHSPLVACDSPIEKLLYCAIYMRAKLGEERGSWDLRTVNDPVAFDALKRDRQSGQDILILQRQITLPEIGRVDFLIHVYGEWTIEPSGGVPGWRRLIVECDGHNFHERTKEQAARDRSRDRAAALQGIEVFRFTGSEIWNDPWGCVGQIIDWAERGV